MTATQTITAYEEKTAQTKTVVNQHLVKSDKDNTYVAGDNVLQEFNVVAPQFSLDPKLINTYYPPSGHQDEGRVLPHIVFNDPHVPWLRDAGLTSWATDPIAGAPAGSSWSGRTKVPWMALMVFEPGELTVDATAATELGLDKLDAWAKSVGKPPTSGAYAMGVSDFLGLKGRVAVETGLDVGSEDMTKLLGSKETTSVIFPTKEKLLDVFTDADGSLAPLNALQMLSHVRHVNNKGMPDYDPTQATYYSVVVANMTGTPMETVLTTQMVHLVSIEHLDTTITAGLKGPSDRIGLISLFSWVYACVPESVDFATTMEALAATAQPLRAPDTVLQTLATNINLEKDAATKAGMKELNKRLQHGYTISRWRTATGEESVAFNRGPLVPVHLPSPFQDARSSPPSAPVPHQPSDQWPVTSMTGKNYQIFDKVTGILDATYASAWSLGKLMAISDGTFTAALTRLRSKARNSAASETLSFVNGVTSKRAVLSSIGSSISTTRELASGNFSGPVSRLNPAPRSDGPKSLNDPQAKDHLPVAIHNAVLARSMTLSGAVFTGLDGQKPVDSDWEIISNWIHDTLFLAHMPGEIAVVMPGFWAYFANSLTPCSPLPVPGSVLPPRLS